MQVITNLETFNHPSYAVVTQGTFDGVHTGHRLILGNIVKLAKEHSGKSILATFHPHPRHVLYKPENNIKLLTTFDERIKLLAETGLDYLIVLPFDDTLSKMPAMNFVRDILVEKIGVDIMVVGYDHRFGRNREGSFQDLKTYAELFGFGVFEIPAHDISAATVSSTKIRQSLSIGDIKTANLFLGWEYFVTGKVTEGRKMGKPLGYPTANILVEDEEKLIPCNGIYAVKVMYNSKEYKGMCSIGNNPTIEGARWSFEVNIFSFDRSIYGEEITVKFVDKLRDEKKFESLDDLKIQLGKDEINAKVILNK